MTEVQSTFTMPARLFGLDTSSGAEGGSAQQTAEEMVSSFIEQHPGLSPWGTGGQGEWEGRTSDETGVIATPYEPAGWLVDGATGAVTAAPLPTNYTYGIGPSRPEGQELTAASIDIRGGIFQLTTVQISDDYLKALADSLSISTDVSVSGDKLVVHTTLCITLSTGDTLSVDSFEGMVDLDSITN